MNQRMENTNSIVELSDESLEQVIGGSGGGWDDSNGGDNWGSNGGGDGGNGGDCGCNRRNHGARRGLGIVGDILGDVFELL